VQFVVSGLSHLPTDIDCFRRPIPALLYLRSPLRDRILMSMPLPAVEYTSPKRERGTYLDQACVYCNGLGHVPCPDRGCSRGTVGSTRADTVGRNTVTGQAIVKIVPIRVACSRCRGKGSVDCDRCSSGTMTRIR